MPRINLNYNELEELLDRLSSKIYAAPPNPEQIQNRVASFHGRSSLSDWLFSTPCDSGLSYSIKEEMSVLGHRFFSLLAKHSEQAIRDYFYQSLIDERSFRKDFCLYSAIMLNKNRDFLSTSISTKDIFNQYILLDPSNSKHQLLLLLAAAYNNLSIVQYLIESDMDLNLALSNKSLLYEYKLCYAYPLHLAASEDHAEMVAFLLKRGGKINQLDGDVTPLHVACLANSTSAVRVLLANEEKPELNAITKSKETPLFIAAKNNFKNLVELLVKAGAADINLCDGNNISPMRIATKKGHLSIVKLLYEKEALLGNKPQPELDLFVLAVKNNHADVAEFWLSKANKKGIPLQACTELYKDFFSTLAKKGFANYLKVFVDNKIDVNAYDDEGKTLLHWAAENSHQEVVRLLLAANADKTLKTKTDNPRSAAGLAKNYETRVLILDWGKTPTLEVVKEEPVREEIVIKAPKPASSPRLFAAPALVVNKDIEANNEVKPKKRFCCFGC